jgi:hypothetical protein
MRNLNPNQNLILQQSTNTGDEESDDDSSEGKDEEVDRW